MHCLESTITVPISLEEAWDFFSKPQNLLKVTPKKMNMRILSQNLPEMYEGMVISYRVAPLFGIPLPWSSEITTVEQNSYFVDSMIEGPFSVWHHEHHFTAVEGGTEVRDIINYKVPLGMLGELFHPLLVKNQVQEIFAYRSEVIPKIFPG